MKKNKLNSHSNILAIEAPKHGGGRYTLSQLKFIFQTAYTGFKACRKSSKNQICIHTGNWGCGAYGGNVSVMAILQLAAAAAADVNKIVYHSFDNSSSAKYKKALSILTPYISQGITMSELFNLILEQNWEWGVGNGT